MRHFLLLSVFALCTSTMYSAQMSREEAREQARQDLWIAIENNKPEKVSQILQAHSYIQSTMPDYTNLTPLMLASIRGHTKVAQILLENHADANATQRDGEQTTALMYAVKYNHPEIVKLLLKHGANTEIHQVIPQLDFYRSPLILAIQKKNRAIVQILLEYNALTNINDISNKTPLMYAIETNQPDIVTLLIESGTDPDIKNKQGNKAIDYAQPCNKVALQKAIQEGFNRRRKLREDVEEHFIKDLADIVIGYDIPAERYDAISNTASNNNDTNPKK